ncbi:GNAT family N-acetyltransferase [Campylobacter sp. 7477a]|uniref:GNAT family N-acetyltransferase n=1 Tax=Campylobacter sp. 7477a TaxID=2735741 RepID=UPI0030145379|nr:GNAT family N-acetyltransferase [Campylobacter sp. 7477a]
MIFKAKKEEASRCIALLRLAMEDAAYYLAGTDNDLLCDEILVKFFQSEVNRVSYNNVYVFKISDEIVGAICVYFGGDLESLDAQILKNYSNKNSKFTLANECEEDEFYIDSIAVSKEFRGQGIATKLIEYVCKVAKERNFSKISLIVDEDKPKTLLFYESLGFKFNKKKMIYGHEYNHLIKEII